LSKQHWSGGKEKRGSISKRGDRYLRACLPPAVIRYAKIHGTKRMKSWCPHENDLVATARFNAVRELGYLWQRCVSKTTIPP
jgi:transposase